MAVLIHLVPGTPEVGLWCPKCLLPSGYQLRLHMLCADGPRQVPTVRQCHECGSALTPQDAS